MPHRKGYNPANPLPSHPMITEADTCRKYVLKKLYESGWTDDHIREQKSITNGRIVVVGSHIQRKPPKRVDYLLFFKPDFPLAVVEAKAAYKNAADGVQQVKEYAQMLDLKFAFSTNGHDIVEYDFITGKENIIDAFPSPDALWHRLSHTQAIETPTIADRLLTPNQNLPGKSSRYYQTISINRAVEAILKKKKRNLLTLATGTGKTFIAFQICWKLWSTRWNPIGEYRKPRILYLADRNVLIDDPKDKMFAPFGDARWKIEGEPIKGRELYFATYQAIARDTRRPGLYREYPKDFFDLIIVDECHRGSARDESNWREILEYFEPAYQLGMTATPLREDNRDTYRYFGNPIYTYSLRQGIEDGFLAPYRVHRVVSTADAVGWRPTKDQKDRYGRVIPDEQYETKDFETVIALRARTEAIAHHLSDFLKKTNRFDKTIVFCVDQEHANDMRIALNNLNSDITRDHPDYVARVVSEEGSIGRGFLSRFQELETEVPAILTTSRLLTTGVDMPTCKNVVLARVIGSMTDFKQIIGRGTRVRDDYGKYFFTIIDYTGSATRLFADPDFDGEPARITEEMVTSAGESVPESEKTEEPDTTLLEQGKPIEIKVKKFSDDSEGKRRKYYVDTGSVEIAAHIVYEMDAEGNQLRVIKYTDFTSDKVRSISKSAAELRSSWSDVTQRALIIEQLEEHGISFDQLAEATNQPDADPLDLLCYIAYNTPLRSRRERAEHIRKEKRDFFDEYSSEAKQILFEILDKYEEHGIAQFKIPEILKVAPISDHGNVLEITNKFGGPDELRSALADMQALLYEG